MHIAAQRSMSGKVKRALPSRHASARHVDAFDGGVAGGGREGGPESMRGAEGRKKEGYI